MPQINRVPSYRRHKPSGQAVVTLDGRDFYLGKYNSAASCAEYNRRIAEWSANDGAVPQTESLTVAELLKAFMRHAERYYRLPNGKPSSELANFKPVSQRIRKLYGPTVLMSQPRMIVTFPERIPVIRCNWIIAATCGETYGSTAST
ncbi:MAG TPA: hypothetical protein VGJ26_01805 [Pirellulales bacterium]|jgi:hypothetical protein